MILNQCPRLDMCLLIFVNYPEKASAQLLRGRDHLMQELTRSVHNEISKGAANRCLF
jgi:hypothetical protein